MITLPPKINLDLFFMMQITIIGFGNQAKSWAQNLRDSSLAVSIALRPQSQHFALSQNMGFPTQELGQKLSGDFFCLLTPDHTHASFLKDFGHTLPENAKIIYAHGYSVTTHKLHESYPLFTHLLLAPKTIGSELRAQFLIKGELGGVYSVEYSGSPQEDEKNLLFLAKAMGLNLGPFPTSFKMETRADLLSEQGILCSMIPYLASEMFDLLTSKGVEPELAYFECWHELKLIVKTMVDIGPEKFFDLISPNALIGSEKGYKKLITPQLTQKIEELYQDIESKVFDEEIQKTDIDLLRSKIATRWSTTGLMKAHQKIHQGKK